jgi:PAS domain-containing protein
MEEYLFKRTDFLKKMFDAIPAILLIVDSDVRIQHANLTASNETGLNIKNAYKSRGGDALHCIHALDVHDGCGHSEFCKDCIIRNSVTKAFNGSGIYREKARMELKTDNTVRELHLLVTASSFDYGHNRYVLLILEDISELIQLRGVLPICANCKKIRNTEDYWETVEHYFSTHVDVEFTHGLCPECVRKLYPEMPDNDKK